MKYVPGLMLTGLLATLPGWAQSSDATAQELIKLENAWTAAIVERDGTFLEQLYADEYLYTGSDGSVADKETDIAEIVSGRVKLESFKLEGMKVRVYGDVAVVTGLNTLKGRYKRKDIGGPYRFTDVLVKRNGRWQVVASHATLASQLCHVTTSISDLAGGRTYAVNRYVPCLRAEGKKSDIRHAE